MTVSRPATARLGRQRADDVVGLDAGLLDHGQPERRDQPADVRDLRAELVGHRGPGLLVGGVERVAERLAGGVEHHRDVVGLFLPQQLGQHVREAQNGVGGQASRGIQRGQGVEGTVDVAAAVDQMQARRAAIRHGLSGGRRRRNP